MTLAPDAVEVDAVPVPPDPVPTEQDELDEAAGNLLEALDET